MGDNHEQAESREPIGEDETLKATLKELAETREEIRRAREEAVQAWLDSMPLVNKLEKLQSNLSRTTNKLELVNIAVASLESLLESTDRSIKYKQEEEAKSKVSMEEMRKEVDRARMEAEEETAGKVKLKEEVRIKRQQLKALQLTQKAVSIETKALNSSINAALRQIKHTKMDQGHDTVAVSHDEYDALCRRVEEETAQANWRITAFEERRKAAEASKAKALEQFEASKAKANLGEIRVDMPTDDDDECVIANNNASRDEFVGEKEEDCTSEVKTSPAHRKRREKERKLQKLKGANTGRKKKMVAKRRSIVERMRCFLCAI